MYVDCLQKNPEAILNATGAWKYWRDVKVGSIIHFQSDTGLVALEVTKFQKKANLEVSFECRRLASDFKSTTHCEYWESSFRFAKPVEVSFDSSDFVQKVLVKNTLNEQIKDEIIKSTRIELLSNKFYVNSSKVDISCLEGEDGSYI